MINYLHMWNTHNPWILDILDDEDFLNADSPRYTSPGCWILRISWISPRWWTICKCEIHTTLGYWISWMLRISWLQISLDTTLLDVGYWGYRGCHRDHQVFPHVKYTPPLDIRYHGCWAFLDCRFPEIHLYWMIYIEDIVDFTKMINYLHMWNTHHPWISDILDVEDFLTADSQRYTSLGCWILRILLSWLTSWTILACWLHDTNWYWFCWFKRICFHQS